MRYVISQHFIIRIYITSYNFYVWFFTWTYNIIEYINGIRHVKTIYNTQFFL